MGTRTRLTVKLLVSKCTAEKVKSYGESRTGKGGQSRKGGGVLVKTNNELPEMFRTPKKDPHPNP
jgi:hypothetical protein